MGIDRYSLGLFLAAPLLIGATNLSGEEESPYTRLSLNGQGYAEQAKEFVQVTASTDTFSTDASTAMSDNAADMARLRARLAQFGVDKNDFRTAEFRFQEGRDPNRDSSDRDRGYIVTHQLGVTIRDTDNVGRIMDALVSAGAKNLSINRYWGYGQVPNPDSLKLAREDAIRDAQAKANDYAQAMGMRVRRIVSITDQGGYARDQIIVTARRVSDTPTQIESRPATVLASVGMVFELEK